MPKSTIAVYQSKKLITALIVSVTLLVSACNDNEAWQESSDDHGRILIGRQTITLTPEHIAPVKSEQYQPSLNLYGRIIPEQQASIILPTDAQLLLISAEEDQVIKKGKTLITYMPTAGNNQETNDSNEHTSTSLIHGRLTDKDLHQQILADEEALSNDITQTIENFAENIENVDIADNHNDRSTHNDDSASLNPLEQRIVAPFDGIISHVYYQPKQLPASIFANTAILNLRSTQLKFIGLLPHYTQSRLSVGQHVNFAIENHDKTHLTGQISNITEVANTHKVAIHVQVIEKDHQPALRVGAAVVGKVDYGQLDIGTLVGDSAIHGTDLSIFTKPNSHIAAPVPAYVWIVNQDQQIVKQEVEVIRYNKEGNQYLVSGIPSEVLIILANLPEDSVGKKLKIS